MLDQEVLQMCHSEYNTNESLTNRFNELASFLCAFLSPHSCLIALNNQDRLRQNAKPAQISTILCVHDEQFHHSVLHDLLGFNENSCHAIEGYSCSLNLRSFRLLALQ